MTVRSAVWPKAWSCSRGRLSVAHDPIGQAALAVGIGCSAVVQHLSADHRVLVADGAHPGGARRADEIAFPGMVLPRPGDRRGAAQAHPAAMAVELPADRRRLAGAAFARHGSADQPGMRAFGRAAPADEGQNEGEERVSPGVQERRFQFGGAFRRTIRVQHTAEVRQTVHQVAEIGVAPRVAGRMAVAEDPSPPRRTAVRTQGVAGHAQGRLGARREPANPEPRRRRPQNGRRSGRNTGPAHQVAEHPRIIGHHQGFVRLRGPGFDQPCPRHHLPQVGCVDRAGRSVGQTGRRFRTQGLAERQAFRGDGVERRLQLRADAGPSLGRIQYRRGGRDGDPAGGRRRAGPPRFAAERSFRSPIDSPRRVAGHGGMGGHVADHYGPGPDGGAVADPDSLDDGGPRCRCGSLRRR